MARIKTYRTASGLDMNGFYPIPGNPPYKINRRGVIIGKYGRPLKPSVNEKGYHGVGLTVNGEVKHYKVHRLVAITFILKGSRNRNCVNHVDGDKSNNIIKNLEWTTQKENINRKTKIPVELTEYDRNCIRNRLAKKYKTLTRSDVYDRLVAKYGVSRDYLSNMNYVSLYSHR